MSDHSDFRVSVVLPVYAGAKPDHLRRALQSIYDQTRLPEEVIVVEDGPLLLGHLTVLGEFDDAKPPLRRKRLERNSGVATATQVGVEAAESPWVARMDADDIAMPGRLAAQVAAARAGGFDLIGAAMLEFRDEDGTILGVRRMPSIHTHIVRRMRTSNPFNHPTVLFRRSLALSVGGYKPLSHVEDYDLFARMWAAGAKLHNLPEPLVRFRADDAMFDRRRQRGIHRAELHLQWNLHTYGLISIPRMIVNLVGRTAFRLLPKPVMRRTYRKLFHRH